jgi:hypothetical protein
MRWLLLLLAVPLLGIQFEGKHGPGKGKHIVLVSGDEEYRSEEALPELARILATRHGFRCTVLFAIDPADGTINPDRKDNIPGLEALTGADLLILFTRFRELPDEQMKHIVEYVRSGRPVVALRTATHAFASKSGAYANWAWNNTGEGWEGGFGRQVLGETWLRHHGKHAVQSTRGILALGAERHPILRGIRSGEIWGPTDVYFVRTPLPGDSKPLVLGQVLTGMNPADPPAGDDKNSPMIPIAWVKTYRGARIFTTTMGAAQDIENEGVRRLLVNATYWATGLEKRIRPRSNVDLVTNFKATPFKFGGFVKGVRPGDLAK